MRQASLRVWLVLSHLVVLCLPVVMVVVSGGLAEDLISQTRTDLENQAALIGLFVERELERVRLGDPDADLTDVGEALGPLLVEARASTLASVRLVDHAGVVVGTSGEELGVDLSSRAEVREALAGARALTLRPRPDPTPQPLDSASRRAQVRLFLGHPIRFEGQTVGAVVLSRTPREWLQALYALSDVSVILIPILLTLGVAWMIGRVATRSLVRLQVVAQRISDGAFAAVDDLDRPAASRIAEVGALATAFRDMARQLQARLGYISEFAGNVSHEFKTPLTTLRGTVELLHDDEHMPADQRKRFLDNALAELDRLSRLVGGLLSLARAEQLTDRSLIDLDGLLREVADRHGIPFHGSAGAVLGHREQLAAIVDNLIDNARRHGGPGVRIEAWHRPGRVGFEVIDDGPGISPANLPRVFDRFFTTARERGGTGLGLALVRAVCVAHGGDASITSRPGYTAVRCELPASRRPGSVDLVRSPPGADRAP